MQLRLTLAAATDSTKSQEVFMNIAILTDTNSGIFPAEGQAHGIHVLPMPVILDGKTYYEGVDLTAEAFYKHLEQGGQVSTSQPAPGDVLSLWEGLLADYDEVVYLPMSSGLSASCRSAIGLAEEFGGKVQVVDNHRISMTLRDAVYDAKALADQGQSAARIKQALEETAADSMIFVGVETLKYLKASGRVTPAGAALGAALNLKPLLKIEGGRLDAYAKVRGMTKCKQKMLQAIQALAQDYAAKGWSITIGAADSHPDPAAGEAWTAQVAELFPGCDIQYRPLPFSIGCHIGPGAFGLTVSRRLAR